MRSTVGVLAMSCLIPGLAVAQSPSMVAPLTQPAGSRPPEEPETTSYRAQSLAVDGVALALLVSGGLAEGSDGEDTGLSDTLFAIGGLGAVFGAPIVHATHGRADRFFGSLGLRWGFSTVGGLVAISMRGDCDDSSNDGGAFLDPDFLCELDYLGYGIFGGLVVAALVDAAFLTDEPGTEERPPAAPRWTPQVSATRDGARAGVTLAW